MSILDEIVSKKKDRLPYAKSKAPLKGLKSGIGDIEPPRDFRAAVRRADGIRLIAEIKKASPSKGLIRPDFDPVDIARIYDQKADAISVLTEADYFQGDLKYIKEVKAVSQRPVLRKDFIIDEYQIWEARAHGADAVLLIAACLEKNQAREYYALAGELG